MKNMNSKMTTNSQLSITESKKQKQKQKQTKQTTRTGTVSQQWRSHGGFSVAGGGEGKVQGVRNVIGRHKIDGERSRMV